MNPTPHRKPKKHEHRSGPSNFADGLDAVLEPGTVIEGVTRLSALGLDMATIDGPLRIQRPEEDSDTEGGQPVLAEGNDEVEDEELLARQDELAAMDRAELKAELRRVDPGFRVFKSDSEDDLRDAILDAEFPG